VASPFQHRMGAPLSEPVLFHPSGPFEFIATLTIISGMKTVTAGYLSTLCVIGVLSSWAAIARAATPHDGQHDFDFGEGTWHTHITRTPDPFGHPDITLTLEGTVTSKKVWGGRAWLEQIEADGPQGHWQAMTLFLYNPRAHQWSMNFLNSQIATLGPPLTGSFDREGQGQLLAYDTFKGRAILVRGIWTKLNADTHEYGEQYSDDGGKTWKSAFLGHKTRIPASAAEPVPTVPNEFDFEIGSFTTHSARLSKPLTGSTQWVETDGSTVVSRIWGGKANLAEIHIDPPFGPIDFLALRWYNPNARQWFLDFANAADGTLGTPMAGVFDKGRADFYDAEPVDGRSTLVHFAVWPTSKDSGASEQAFSADGGHTWEVNYKTRYTRVQ
jgi:hypothetical protein